MGVNLHGRDDLDGYEWSLIREVLRAVEREKGPIGLAERKTKPFHLLDVVGAFEAAVAHGFIGDPALASDRPRNRHNRRYVVTEAGDTVLAARLARKTPRNKALTVLKQLLEQCAAVNADEELPRFITEVWLAGSLAKGAAEVGDIDIAVRWERRAWRQNELNQQDRDPNKDSVWDLAIKRGMPASAFEYPAQYYLESRLCQWTLFGKRRNPILSPIEFDTLVGMHDVCQCVFDHARGGIVNDPILPHHPQSKERSKQMPAQRVLAEPAADLPFRPTDAACLARWGHHGDYHLLPRAIDDLIDMHRTAERGSHMIAAHETDTNEMLKKGFSNDELASIDGRARCILAVSPGYYAYRPQDTHLTQAMHVTRRVDPSAGTIAVDVHPVRLAPDPRYRHAYAPDLFVMLGALISIDADRLTRHRGAGQIMTNLSIDGAPADAILHIASCTEQSLARAANVIWTNSSGRSMNHGRKT